MASGTGLYGGEIGGGDAKANFYSNIGGMAGSYGPDQVDSLAQQYSSNPYGVSFQELQGLFANGAKAPSGTPGTAVDPYAAFGGTAAYNAKMAGYNQQNQGIKDYETLNIANQGIGLNQGIMDLVDSSTKAQNAINQSAKQNYMSKMQGVQNINDMISHGLQSGGVQLANKNASNSSAGEALARAYSMLGRSQLSGVGNQFAQGQDKINTAQTNANIDMAGGIRHQQDAKLQAINGIVADANQKLQYLDSVMNGASMPDRFNIAQEQQDIKNQAINALQQYDTQLSNSTSSIKPNSEDERSQQARDLFHQGTAPDTSFQYSNIAPGQFQGTGPFASQLPIFTIPSSKKIT